MKLLSMSMNLMLLIIFTYPGMYKMIYEKKLHHGSNKVIEYYIQLASGLVALTKPIWNSFIYFFRLKSIRSCVWKIFDNKDYPDVELCRMKTLKR